MRYLAHFVVTASGVKRLSVVAFASNGRWLWVEPFGGETAATTFVPGILVVVQQGIVNVSMLHNAIKETIAATADAIAAMVVSSCGQQTAACEVYVVNPVERTVTKIM